MPVKYHCPKCGRRFVDWGAEKLGFKCPDCDDEELVRAGVSEERPARRASLKRAVRKAAPVEPVGFDDEEVFAERETVDEGEVEEVEPEEAIVEADPLLPVDEEEAPGFVRSPAELITDDTDEDEVDLDMPEDLNFGEVAPTISEESFEESDEENWNG